MVIFDEMDGNDIGFLFKLLNEEEIINIFHRKRFTYDELFELYRNATNDYNDKHYIIKENNIKVGWLRINGLEEEGTAWIAILAISKEYQHKGIGTSAVKFAEEYFTKNGNRKISLHTTDDNVNAKSLYLKAGYTIINAEEKIRDNGDKVIYLTFTKDIEDKNEKKKL
ncbi:hypothetical protein FACS1894142_5400 [Spirochaetia bacterium]|nr:hypothetical protein FACS1894142_5400 [Spirochaetia bacterium]